MKITNYFQKLIDICSKKHTKVKSYPEEVEITDSYIEDFFNKPKKSKKEISKEYEEKGFLPQNEEYEGCTHATQEDVEKEPRKYIIEECVEACEILWSKNIFTYMCSEFCDNNAWIELIEDDLSVENLEIINNLKNPYKIYKGYHNGSVMVIVPTLGLDAKELLIRFADMLKMQDVPKREATITRINALIQSGYGMEIKNPAYVPYEKFEERIKSLNPIQRYNELEKYLHSVECEEYISDVDETKIDRPVEEILKENGYIISEDNHKIYKNAFYYKKHLKYLKSLKPEKQSHKLS